VGWLGGSGGRTVWFGGVAPDGGRSRGGGSSGVGTAGPDETGGIAGKAPQASGPLDPDRGGRGNGAPETDSGSLIADVGNSRTALRVVPETEIKSGLEIGSYPAGGELLCNELVPRFCA
jgi:hypothetical protein